MKKTDIALNLKEIKVVQKGLNHLYQSGAYTKEQRLIIDKLEELLDEKQLELEEHEMYVDDKDGYKRLTEEAYEGLAEKYGRKDE